MDFFREYYILSHFAKIENGIVTQVIVAEQDFINSGVVGQGWVQTSYNTRGNVHFGQDGQPDGGIALNKNYAGIGYTWDGIGFAVPQPYPSWTLNQNSYLWESPIPYPNDGKRYIWDESTISWIENNGI
jgi:hypothetical protein